MPRNEDDKSWPEYASAPCFLHELDPSFTGLRDSMPPAEDIGPWRKAKRARLISKRQVIASEQRHQWDTDLRAALKDTLGEVRDAMISIYWPFRGEPDLRPMLTDLMACGAEVALPVVVEKGKPLLFRKWRPGEPLQRGIWNIPYPSEGTPVRPDIVIAPVVGFDRAAYRLGYGGGFFDRTLATIGAPVQAIGVGYSLAEIPTIHPQSHDIAMNLIVTEAEVIKGAQSS